ncbi:hypothetical protein CHUAL_001428 [Chamberlinius hualienensis]
MISSAAASRMGHRFLTSQKSIPECCSIRSGAFDEPSNLINSLISKYRNKRCSPTRIGSKRKSDETMICGRPARRDAELLVEPETEFNDLPSLQTIFKKQRINPRHIENSVEQHRRFLNIKLTQQNLALPLNAVESPLINNSTVAGYENLDTDDDTSDQTYFNHVVQQIVDVDEEHKPNANNQQAFEFMKENEARYKLRNSITY